MATRSEAALSRISQRGGGARCGQVSEIGTFPHRVVRLVGDVRIEIARDASIDARVDAIAARQRARLTRRQLLAAGVSPGAIARRLRKGALERIHAGVYGLPHTAGLPLAAETAALLACGEGAVLSHHTAATLWRLRPGIARPVHVTICACRGFPSPAGVKVHRSRTIAPADVRLHQGLPITSPARTALDVAAGLGDRDIERLLDEAVFARRLLTRREIDDVLTRTANHPGHAKLARVAGVHTRSTKTESSPEEKLLRLIRAAGLPEPELQANVLGYRLDFYWPRHRLAVEVDAYGTHGSHTRFEADRRRDARLLAEKSIVVLRVTKLAIENRQPEVTALLARTIAQQAPASAARGSIPAVQGRW